MGKSCCVKADNRLTRPLGVLVAVLALVAIPALLAAAIASAQPLASFTITPSTPKVAGTQLSFDASGSTDSSATIESYQWTWGDGSIVTDSSPTATHIYSTPGTYTVTLTVTDSNDEQNSSSQTVTVYPDSPDALITIESSAPYMAGASIDFSGLGSTDPDSTISSYSWNWGDGSQDESGATPSHTFAAGTYTVTLTVTDAYGETSTAQQTLTVDGPPPSASFAFSPGTAQVAGTALRFDGTGSSDPDSPITSYVWNWGDGSTESTGSTATHSFSSPGGYNVTLTLTNAEGQTGQITHAVAVTAPPPAAAFNPGAATVLTYSTVAFDGTLSSDPDGTITGYSWSFGDGSTSSAAKPTHAFASLGTYTVTLTVTDSNGNSSQVSHQVVVVNAPGPAILIEPPMILTSGSSSTTSAGVIDLGKRLFCLAYGPSCTAMLSSTSTSLARDPGTTSRLRSRKTASKTPAKTAPKPPPSAGTAKFTASSNGSVELTLHLTKQALALLRKRGRLAIKITVALVRGTQHATDVVSLTLRYPPAR